MGMKRFPAWPIAWSRWARAAPVLFVNDSKATNADAAERALTSFEDVFWIAGGKPKAGGITPLAPFFPRVRKAYLIGESAADFAATLGADVPHEVVGTLDKAVTAAARDAQASACRIRWCCCRPPAPASTSSPISRCGAMPSAIW